jgi:hypothetical protein
VKFIFAPAAKGAGWAWGLGNYYSGGLTSLVATDAAASWVYKKTEWYPNLGFRLVRPA